MDDIPCIRGLRIPASTIVAMLSKGLSESDILAAYPDLESEDIRESLRFSSAVRERVLQGARKLDEGAFTEYEGPKALRNLADRVKSRARRRIAAKKSRKK